MFVSVFQRILVLRENQTPTIRLSTSNLQKEVIDGNLDEIFLNAARHAKIKIITCILQSI